MKLVTRLGSVPKFWIVHCPCLHGVKSDYFLTLTHHPSFFASSLIYFLLLFCSCPFSLPFISLAISHVSPPPLFPFFMSAVTIFCSPVFNFCYLAVIAAGVLDRLTIGYLFNALILPCKRHAARPSLQIILNCLVNSLHTYPVGLSTSRQHWNIVQSMRKQVKVKL